VFEAPDVIKRFEKMGDLHAPVLKLKQKLPDVRAAASSAQAAKPTEKIELAAQAEEPEPEPKSTRRVASVNEAGKPAKRATAPRKSSTKTSARKRRAV
jgi:hypothetical protein